jgi:hypothetical protein
MADAKNLFEYNEESIRSLDWKEHIGSARDVYRETGRWLCAG